MCILGLSSVLGRKISTYYPDCGADRYKLLFNRLVLPRQIAQKSFDNIHILFCHDGHIKPGEVFQSNHFVPLLSTQNCRNEILLSHWVQQSRNQN